MFIPSLRRLARRWECFMKNQCPVCIRGRTMKTQTGTILVACLAIAAFKSPAASVEVSSKVDLDSDENEDTSSNMAFDAIEDPNKSASLSRMSEQPTADWHRGSELVKPRETRKRRIYTARDASSSQPKVINNIQIVVNGNGSLPSVNSCKRGICNVSVSSKPDGKGNIVTEVHLSIITKAKPDVLEVNDVPVIDGFRGASKELNERPIVYPTHSLNLLHSYLHREYIPQIQTSYQGYGEPWYQHRRIFQQPPVYWNYQSFGDRGEGFRGHKTWSRERPVVDDKIEPPLSKTKPSKDTTS
ncbi:uncharacterized protein LOC105186826 [Harpegnathos saltator]|uniref:uncharacterized protein LOC105186826 n=1 Tax=Harpegnathos saltator TaxID=610380 RepID=UPI000DBEF075|nr:uncharacterized protein LOC105186826 [Harpegnathos saltator]